MRESNSASCVFSSSISTRAVSSVMLSTVLSMTEDTARVLMLLLKTQLAEFDSRKAKSRR